MDDENLIGEIVPLNSETEKGWMFSGDLLKMDGLVVTTVHPTTITISSTQISFSYGDVSRDYMVTKTGDKITKIIAPDGAEMVVTYV